MYKKCIVLILIMTRVARADPVHDKFFAVTHFLETGAYEKLFQLAEKYKGADSQERQYTQDLRNIYCNRTVSRFVVNGTIRFTPKVESYVPLDSANEETAKQLEMAKFFFKQDFLYASSGGKDLSQYILYKTFSRSDYHKFFERNKRLAVDMQLLLHHFTFRIPQETVETMYGTTEDAFRMNKFGYGDGDQFQASEAINFKDYIWRYVLIHDTQIKTAPSEDGSTAFEISWTPDYFCKYAVPEIDLKT